MTAILRLNPQHPSRAPRSRAPSTPAVSPASLPEQASACPGRALRSRGVKGSNEALNALALTLSAELASDTAGRL